METLDTLSGHTDGGWRWAHDIRSNVCLESRTYYTRGESPDHQLEPVLGSREEGHSRDRREVTPTATRMQWELLKQVSRVPRSTSKEYSDPRCSQRWSLPAQRFSHPRENDSYSYNSLCTRAASRSTGGHSRYGTGGHGLVVNKAVLGLWLDSTILEIFSNLNVPMILCKIVHFTT